MRCSGTFHVNPSFPPCCRRCFIGYLVRLFGVRGAGCSLQSRFAHSCLRVSEGPRPSENLIWFHVEQTLGADNRRRWRKHRAFAESLMTSRLRRDAVLPWFPVKHPVSVPNRGGRGGQKGLRLPTCSRCADNGRLGSIHPMSSDRCSQPSSSDAGSPDTRFVSTMFPVKLLRFWLLDQNRGLSYLSESP